MMQRLSHILVLLILAPLFAQADDLCVIAQAGDKIVVPPSSCFFCEIHDNGPAIAQVREALRRQLAMAERKFTRINLALRDSSLNANFSFRARQRVKVLRAVLRSNASLLQSMLDEVPGSVSSCEAPQTIFCSGIDYSSSTSGILSISNIIASEVLERLLRIQARIKLQKDEKFPLRIQQRRAERLMESVDTAVAGIETLHMQCGE